MTFKKTANSDWTAPVPVDGLNELHGYAARLQPGGRTILFSSNQDNGALTEGQSDIYLARLVRKDAPVEPIKGLEEDDQTVAEPSAAVSTRKLH